MEKVCYAAWKKYSLKSHSFNNREKSPGRKRNYFARHTVISMLLLRFFHFIGIYLEHILKAALLLLILLSRNNNSSKHTAFQCRKRQIPQRSSNFSSGSSNNNSRNSLQFDEQHNSAPLSTHWKLQIQRRHFAAPLKQHSMLFLLLLLACG